ncbi:MAG: hypothetical protein HUU11_16650 [Anaerolineales bacterium]|nr:hypothetical protein [Anaerolineales bacterium]
MVMAVLVVSIAAMAATPVVVHVPMAAMTAMAPAPAMASTAPIAAPAPIATAATMAGLRQISRWPDHRDGHDRQKHRYAEHQYSVHRSPSFSNESEKQLPGSGFGQDLLQRHFT